MAVAQVRDSENQVEMESLIPILSKFETAFDIQSFDILYIENFERHFLMVFKYLSFESFYFRIIETGDS